MTPTSLSIGSVHGAILDHEALRVYPCLIRPARYGGGYSGAQWHAWPVRESDMIPSKAYGSDVSCNTFWSTQKESGVPMVGLGETPNAAHQALIIELQDAGRVLKNGDHEKTKAEDIPGLNFYIDQ